jgi:hypothetical protein
VSGKGLPGEVALWERLRTAEKEILWTPVPTRGGRRRGGAPPATVRRAKLHDEEARFELSESDDRAVAIASSGPVGALLLLLEMDRRGPPGHLRGRAASRASGYPDGAIEAEWGSGTVEDGRPEVPLGDLIALVRYAL